MSRSRNTQPTLSIIVPVLNESRTLIDTMSALKPFRQRGAEIIVVDGGSDDDTAVLAHPFADRVIKGPRGRATQMNEGAKVASGFIFLFLPSDTTLPSDADTQVVVGRARDTSVWGRFDMRLAGRHPLLPMVARFLNRRSRSSGIASCEQAIFVQRETFFRIGGFTDIPVMEDVELSKRLRAISPPICVTSRVIVPAKRFDRDGLWTTLRTMWLMRMRYRMGMKPEEILKRYVEPKPKPASLKTRQSIKPAAHTNSRVSLSADRALQAPVFRDERSKIEAGPTGSRQIRTRS